MPHHESCKKRLKQNKKRNAYNKHYKSTMRTAVKKVNEAESKEIATPLLIEAQSILDKLVSKGIMKKNNASNKKSKLMKHVAGLQ